MNYKNKILARFAGAIALSSVSLLAVAYNCPSPENVKQAILAAMASGDSEVKINTSFGTLETIITSLKESELEYMTFANAEVLYTLDDAAEEPTTASCAYYGIGGDRRTFIPLYVYYTGTPLLYQGSKGAWTYGDPKSSYIECTDSYQGCVFVNAPPPAPPK